MLYISSILSVVLVMVDVGRLEGCQCTPLAGTKYHYWIENTDLKDYIEIADSQILLNGYQENMHANCLFATDYYGCPNRGGMHITTRIRSQYLANKDSTDQAADVANRSSLGTSLCHDDYVMFKCTEGGGEELASLESFPSGNYLDINQSDGSVVVGNNSYFWTTISAVFANLTISSQSTAMTAAVNVSGIFDMYAVTRPQIGYQPEISVNGAPCRCRIQDENKTHFWREKSFHHLYIRIVNEEVYLSGFQMSLWEQYWFTTKFYFCEGESSGLYLTSQIGPFYLANIGGEIKTSTPEYGQDLLLCFDYPEMFRYKEGGGEELGTLQSFPDGKYLSGSENEGSLVLTDEPYIWISLPAVISHKVNSCYITMMLAKMRASGVLGRYVVTSSAFGDRPDIRRLSPYEAPFKFEVIPYRLCKRIDSNGRIVQGTAIVLRSTLQLSAQKDITVPITDNGKIPLPFGQGDDSNSPVPYNLVDFKFYDDVARSNNSYIYKTDIRDQRVIDERFFEVLKQTDGTYRLLSTLHPDRYLAIIQQDEALELVVAPLSSNPNSIINYNFEMNITGLINTDFLHLVNSASNVC